VTTLGGDDVEIYLGPSAIESGYPESGLLGLDVESTYLTDRGQFDPDFRVRTVQIATKRVARVFDVDDPLQRERAIEVLSDPAYSFCSHTDMDVLAIWTSLGIDISARNVDTRMLAIQADPDNNSDRDLKTLATKYGMPELAAADAELEAWMREEWVTTGGGKRNAKKTDIEAFGWNMLAEMASETWPEVFTRYAGLDAVACRRLAELLVPDTHMPPELLRVDQWLHVRTTRQRMAGKRIDTEALATLHAEATTITSQAKTAAEELTGGVNINGPKILDWLAEHGADWSQWEAAGGATTPKGMPSLAKENISLLLGDGFALDLTAKQVVELMREQKGSLDLLRKTTDVTSRLVTHADGIARIHPLVNPIGATTTARMSSSGPNVQNFSKKDPRMRGLFLPEPGYTFVTADFAQIELRVVAALAREDKMIDVIKSGGDLHDLTVDLLAERGVTITRDIAKMTNFLIVYGGGAKALHDQGGVPMDVAMEVIRVFREQYTDIARYAQYMGMETEAIRTISGRRLPVTRVKGSGDRAGELRSYANVNYAVQSAARECLVTAWIDLEERHGRAGIVWLPVHDELVLMVPDDEIEAVIADVEDSMTFDFRGVPIEADAIVLLDEHGVSRWMPGKHAEKIAAAKAERVAA
jgi:DNA polymerase I